MTPPLSLCDHIGMTLSFLHPDGSGLHQIHVVDLSPGAERCVQCISSLDASDSISHEV
jgi:hypothetical protein